MDGQTRRLKKAKGLDKAFVVMDMDKTEILVHEVRIKSLQAHVIALALRIDAKDAEIAEKDARARAPP